MTFGEADPEAMTKRENARSNVLPKEPDLRAPLPADTGECPRVCLEVSEGK